MRTSLKQFGMTLSALVIGAAVAPRHAKAMDVYEEDQGTLTSETPTRAAQLCRPAPM
jgi:hypothetical protein